MDADLLKKVHKGKTRKIVEPRGENIPCLPKELEFELAASVYSLQSQLMIHGQ